MTLQNNYTETGSRRKPVTNIVYLGSNNSSSDNIRVERPMTTLAQNMART